MPVLITIRSCLASSAMVTQGPVTKYNPGWIILKRERNFAFQTQSGWSLMNGFTTVVILCMHAIWKYCADIEFCAKCVSFLPKAQPAEAPPDCIWPQDIVPYHLAVMLPARQWDVPRQQSWQTDATKACLGGMELYSNTCLLVVQAPWNLQRCFQGMSRYCTMARASHASVLQSVWWAHQYHQLAWHVGGWQYDLVLHL